MSIIGLDRDGSGTVDEPLSYSYGLGGLHTLEIRNRAERNRQSSGYKVRFKQLVTNKIYDLKTWLYSYDALERVMTANACPGMNATATPLRAYAYGFDTAGNRISQSVALNGGAPTVTTYTHDAANRITNAGFSYDSAGRMTSDSVNTYAWGRADRLLSMGGSAYQYNGLSQRAQQTVGTDATKYLLDVQPGLFQVLAETKTDRPHATSSTRWEEYIRSSSRMAYGSFRYGTGWAA